MSFINSRDLFKLKSAQIFSHSSLNCIQYLFNNYMNLMLTTLDKYDIRSRHIKILIYNKQ